MEDAQHVEPIHTSKDTFIRLNYDKMELSKIQEKLLFLYIRMQLKTTDNIDERLSKTMCIIKSNLTFFTNICKHIDMVYIIIDYLKFARDVLIEKGEFDLLTPILFTIFDICNNAEINLFLLQTIIMQTDIGQRMFNTLVPIFYNFTDDKSICKNNLWIYNDQHHSMILLEDSDIYAVVKYLKRSNHLAYLKHIWIHELIYSKFLWLLDYYKIILDAIIVFRFKQEILCNTCDKCTADIIKIISIWSEDIIGAKNFARSLNATVLYINAHMHFCGNMIIFPYSKLTELSIDIHIRNWTHYFFTDPIVDPYSRAELHSNKKYYNLYYNGMWQRPVKDTYWLHEDKIYANASKDDLNGCLDSAKKGFKIWSNMSIDVKSNILNNFVLSLHHAGYTALSSKISKWISSAALYNNSLTSLNASQTGEITTIYKPRGILLLHERSRLVFWYKLILSLMTGNTVIVLITRNSCTSVASYFNMFLTSKIPSGVVNLLSSTMKLENIKSGFFILPDTYKFGFDLSNDEFFETRDNVDEIYTNLTVPKCIILPLK